MTQNDIHSQQDINLPTAIIMPSKTFVKVERAITEGGSRQIISALSDSDMMGIATLPPITGIQNSRIRTLAAYLNEITDDTPDTSTLHVLHMLRELSVSKRQTMDNEEIQERHYTNESGIHTQHGNLALDMVKVGVNTPNQSMPIYAIVVYKPFLTLTNPERVLTLGNLILDTVNQETATRIFGPFIGSFATSLSS